MRRGKSVLYLLNDSDSNPNTETPRTGWTGVFWSPIAFSLVASVFGALGKKLEKKGE